MCCSAVYCVVVCCSTLRCGAVCCSVLQCVAVCCSVLQCVAVWCSLLQCGAAWCSALQCNAVRCSALNVFQSATVCCSESVQCLMSSRPLAGSIDSSMKELKRIMSLQHQRTQRVKFEVEHIIGSKF